MRVPNYYRWVALTAAVVFQASTFALLTFCFAFWVKPWISEFEVSITQVMFIMTSVMLVIGGCSALAGRFFDRYPINRIVALGVVIFAGGLWLGSYAESYAPNVCYLWRTIALCNSSNRHIGKSIGGSQMV